MKYDVIVVGGGIMGSATAYWISKAGKSVLLIDQFKIENSINASYDYSRIFRYSYGKDEFYTNMAVESLKLWQEVEREAGKQLYFNCGALYLGNKGDDFAMESFRTLKKLGHRVSLLEFKELQEKYPQFYNVEYGVLDHNAGIIEANSAVLSLVELAKHYGAEVLEETKANKIENRKVLLENEVTVDCEKIVLTCGSWVQNLIEEYVPIKLRKGQTLYLKPKDKYLFSKDKLPVYIHREAGFFGIPIHGIDAVKFAPTSDPIDLDSVDVEHTIDDKVIEDCSKQMKSYLPKLEDAELVATRVCLHDMTPDGDFIIDKLDENIILGAGFSGHGFKFAPLVGKILADLTLTGRTQHDISRFSLNRF